MWSEMYTLKPLCEDYSGRYKGRKKLTNVQFVPYIIFVTIIAIHTQAMGSIKKLVGKL